MLRMPRACSMAETVQETARLVLRTWQEADVEPFLRQLNTPAVMRWLGGVQEEASFRSMVERIHAAQVANGYCFWIIEGKAEQAILGMCGLHKTERPGTPVDGLTEIGWRLKEAAWGRGYAREAAEAALTVGFSRFALERIVAFTVPQNAPSWGLMQRLGMIRARALDFIDTRLDPDIADHIVYAIDRKDWIQ